MADHGQLINSRTYWAWTGADGKPAYGDTPPGGPSRPFGIGSSAPAATQYQEQTYEDGTKVLSRFDPAQGEHGAWVQESIEVDPQIRAQHQAGKTEAAAAAKDQAAADKPIEVGGKLVKPDGKGGYVTVWDGTDPNAGPKPVEIGGRLVQPDGKGGYTGVWEPPAAAPKQEDVLTPVARPGAPRPGQRTDLASVIDAANQYQQQLWNQYKAKQITIDQLNQQWNAYYQNTVLPAQQRATQEANDYAATQAQRSHDADVRAQTATDRANDIRQQEHEPPGR